MREHIQLANVDERQPLRITNFAALALIALLLVCARGAMAQNSSPEAALEEFATTDNIEVARKHLPAAVVDSLSQIPVKEQARILDEFFVHKIVETQGGALHQKEDGTGWEVIDQEGRKWTAATKPAFYFGSDALVPVEIKGERETVMAFVKMQLEGGDWRISDFGVWKFTSIEVTFLRRLAARSESEQAAVGALRALNDALGAYPDLFPSIGLPTSLAVLSGAGDDKERTPDHAKLSGRKLDDNPLLIDGYEFHYRLIDRGNASTERRARYQLTARPLEFGKTGTSSLYTDETGVIRFTRENREADSTDPALGGD